LYVKCMYVCMYTRTQHTQRNVHTYTQTYIYLSRRARRAVADMGWRAVRRASRAPKLACREKKISEACLQCAEAKGKKKHTCVCVYVCMCVCMYVCMYASLGFV